MRSVAELAGKRLRRALPAQIVHEWPLPDTLMGIEVEAEAYRNVTMPDDLVLWSIKTDGSLQNGREYVLRSPMAGNELRTAINELMQGSTFVRSLTGSTHIHMDMLEQEDSSEILRVLVMLVYVLEPMLYAAGDRGREWCGFANKLMSGPDEILTAVMNEEISPSGFRQTYGRNSSTFGRYYGMNMAALIDYGSLEFRYFPTATKEEELISWVELVQSFKKAARDIGTIQNLDNVIENENRFREFLNTYFGKWSNLFESLGDFHMLRNDYRKAHITANLKATKLRNTVFVARKVFSDDKYKKLLKKMPSLVGEPYKITFAASADMVPNAEPGNIMVYRGQVYLVPSEESSLNLHIPAAYWSDLNNIPSSRLAQDGELCDALRTLVSQAAASPGTITRIGSSYIYAIENLPSSGTVAASQATADDPTGNNSWQGPTELADLASTDDYDDYESEMEDE